MPHVAPLAIEALPEDIRATMETALRQRGFVANSVLTMARKPEILRGFQALFGALATSLTIKQSLRQMMFHIMSHEAGCRYCQAHSINFLKSAPDVPPEKLEALWEYETSPLFDPAERAALRFSQASAQTPNAVTEDDFAALREHFDEDQIVEIVAVLAVGAFLNRWNDTMATELEAPPRDFAETTLGAKGWSVGKHG